MITVFGVYGDDDTKQRVEVALEHLAGRLGGNFQLTTVLQQFDTLGKSPSPQEPHTSAADADILILALEFGARLQIELVDWLEKWAADRNVADAALGVFTHGPGPVHLPTIEMLRQLTERHGLALLLSGDDVAGHAQKTKAHQPLPQAIQVPFTTYLPEGVAQRWDHSGINE